MSQKKVDYYKEQKRNRAEILRKEKRNRRLGIVLAVVILAAAATWLGYLIVQNTRSTSAGSTQATELDVAEMESYLDGLETLIGGEEAAEESASSTTE